MTNTANQSDNTMIVHRIDFNLVPIGVVEEMFRAAIAVGFASGDGGYKSRTKDAKDRMKALMKEVDIVSSFYATPVSVSA